MASKIDMSLNDLIDMKRKKRGGLTGRGGGVYTSGRGRGGIALRGRGWGFRGGRGSPVVRGRGGPLAGRLGYAPNFNKPASPVTPQTGDLRDLLAKKQKTTVTDLRSKLQPKAPAIKSPTLPSGRGTSASYRGTARSTIAPRGRPQEVGVTKSRRSDPGPIRSPGYRHRAPPAQVPSYAEAKKITVTVPGLSQPVSREVSRCCRGCSRGATSAHRSGGCVGCCHASSRGGVGWRWCLSVSSLC